MIDGVKPVALVSHLTFSNSCAGKGKPVKRHKPNVFAVCKGESVNVVF